jgi:hypothetical protein
LSVPARGEAEQAQKKQRGGGNPSFPVIFEGKELLANKSKVVQIVSGQI